MSGVMNNVLSGGNDKNGNTNIYISLFSLGCCCCNCYLSMGTVCTVPNRVQHDNSPCRRPSLLLPSYFSSSSSSSSSSRPRDNNNYPCPQPHSLLLDDDHVDVDIDVDGNNDDVNNTNSEDQEEEEKKKKKEE